MRFTHSLMGLGLAVISLPTLAQVAPDAGQSLQSIDQAPLQLPSTESIELNLPDTPSTDMSVSGPNLQVNGFSLSGNLAIDSAELLSLLDDLRGRTVSLGELQTGANRITRLYRERGYPLTRAYVPAQEIDAGVVQIAVLEGRYGEIQVQNSSRLRPAGFAPLNALQAGDTVHAKPLERSLLLLSDTPGVRVQSTLTPGASVGATDLLVDIEPGPLVSGAVDMDNYGNRYTGAYRLGATVNLNNPLGLGDRLSLRAMGTEKDQRYYRAAYQLPVGPWATQVGVAYSDMDYELARDFGDLGAHGNARIASVHATQPLVRSRDFSLYAQLQFDDKRLKDDIDLFDSKSDKRSRVVIASLSGNSRDNFIGGGVNSFNLAWSRGSLNIDGELNQLIDELGAGTQGRFNKLNPSLVRLQRLSNRFSLYTQVQGQWTDGNLDSSEKISLGGAYGVRAYPQGEVSGDQGWLAQIELRYRLGALSPYAFYDFGRIDVNANPGPHVENRKERRSGAGVGVRWLRNGWRMDAVTAWRVSGGAPQSDTRDPRPRTWLNVSYYF